MPRQARLDYPVILRHVICRGIEKKDIVSDDKDRDNLIERMGGLAQETETAMYEHFEIDEPMTKLSNAATSQ